MRSECDGPSVVGWMHVCVRVCKRDRVRVRCVCVSGGFDET